MGSVRDWSKMQDARHGTLTVTGTFDDGAYKYFRCSCDCGGVADVRASDWARPKSGPVRCQACRAKTHVRKGKKYGKLTALRPLEHRDSSGHIFWLCRCKCGVNHQVSSANLSGEGPSKTRSCGKC